MDALIVARCLHVLDVVVWIGGVAWSRPIAAYSCHGYPPKSRTRLHGSEKEGTVLPVFDDGTTPVIAIKGLRCSFPGGCTRRGAYGEP